MAVLARQGRGYPKFILLLLLGFGSENRHLKKSVRRTPDSIRTFFLRIVTPWQGLLIGWRV